MSGTVVDVLTNAAFDVPTTIARHGNALYAVNLLAGVDTTGGPRAATAPSPWIPC